MKRLSFRYHLKVYKKNKLVSSFDTGKSKRFLYRCKAQKFSDSTKRVYIKVLYPCRIKGIQAYNDGIYNNYKDLIQAAKAFTEK
jgi:hypothetical protein